LENPLQNGNIYHGLYGTHGNSLSVRFLVLDSV
jgi:hypothetical protein